MAVADISGLGRGFFIHVNVGRVIEEVDILS